MENLLELQKKLKTDSIINQLGNRNEPVALNSRALYDYDGSVYGITAFFLNSDSQRIKNSFLISDRLTSDVFFNPEKSQADCLWSLLSAYGNDLKSLRLLVNNVEFGMKLKKMQVHFSNYRLNKQKLCNIND